MKRSRIAILCACLASLCLPQIMQSAQDRSMKLTGTIDDSACAFKVHSVEGNHDQMVKAGIMGKTPQECARGCVREMGSKYVLVVPASGTHKRMIYRIAEQDKVDPFAGQTVTISASRDAKPDTIHILTISAAVN